MAADSPVTIVVEHLRRRVAGGIGTYTRGLLQGLATMGPDAPPIDLVSGRPALGGLAFPVRANGPSGRFLTPLWDAGLATGLVRGAARMHAPSTAVPFRRGVPTAVTVHDLAFREVPSAFPPRGRRWHEASLRRCLARASLLVVPSERTASLLDAGDRVVVIPEGCDHLAPADQPAADLLLRRLGVVTPYLLSVSTLEPRKNLARLLEAYSRAVPDLPEPWPLVVVGPQGWGATLAPTPGVKLAGMVDDAVLAALYAGARCVAYVPLVEGWGLPAVEAMAACAPVVASPMPSTGGAALEVGPTDVAAIAAGLVVAATDERRRSELVTAGLLRAGELTWEAAARAHVGAWERL